jgi:hypothetical protein
MPPAGPLLHSLCCRRRRRRCRCWQCRQSGCTIAAATMQFAVVLEVATVAVVVVVVVLLILLHQKVSKSTSL